MKFLDVEGVKQIKQYVDGKFITIEDHNNTEQITSAALNDLSTRILNIENQQGTSNESDPIFSSSVAAEITSNDITNWNSKTDNIGTITQINIGSTEYTPSDGIVSLPTYPTTLPASDVSSWAKASTKPSYTASEVGALPSTTVIPTVSDGTLTIQKNGTNVQTFTANQSSNVIANIQVNEVPSYSSSNNGQILMVVNGTLTWVSPAVIYSGNSVPSNDVGNNGDVYLQS